MNPFGATTLVLVLLALVTSVSHLLALDLVLDVIRDNWNYASFFQSIDGSSLLVCYKNYYSYVGASEPVFFICFLLLHAVGFDYYAAILFLDFFFLFSLAKFLICLDVPRRYLLIFIISLAFNYYLFVLFSELHRLKLGLSFFFLAFSFKGVLRNLLVFASVLSHFQLIVLLPIFFHRKKDAMLLVLVAIFAIMVFGDALGAKLLYYLNHDGAEFADGALRFLVIVMYFTLSCYLIFLGLPKAIVSYWILVLIPILVVGHERLNILLIGGTICLILYFMSKQTFSVNRVRLLGLMLFPLCIYDAYKILLQYKDLSL